LRSKKGKSKYILLLFIFKKWLFYVKLFFYWSKQNINDNAYCYFELKVYFAFYYSEIVWINILFSSIIIYQHQQLNNTGWVPILYLAY